MSDYNKWNDYQYAEAYHEAEQKVKARIGFYWHLASYLTVNGMLVAIYLITAWSVGNYYPWFIWPLLGWGVGLLLHFVGVFVIFDNPANRQRMIEKELRNMGMALPTSIPDPTSPPANYQETYTRPTTPPTPEEPLVAATTSADKQNKPY